MSELNILFRRRIGFPEKEKITFANLEHVLAKAAVSIPFENLRIMQNTFAPISRENLVQKVLVQQEGGLCYELNPMLYLFLLENGFDARLTTGVVYNHTRQKYPTFGRTHVAILLAHEGQTYLVDSGFGANLPLRPVPLNGETVVSANGEFRIKQVESVFGDHVLEMKLKYKDTEWRTGYAFYSGKTLRGVSECNLIQKIIVEHPESSFNKSPLLTKLTDRGSVTLTDTSLTKWEDGVVTKEEVDGERFRELAREIFGI